VILSSIEKLDLPNMATAGIMHSERRNYPINLVLNGIFISKIIIDPHYELKHKESISDALIMDVFLSLNGSVFELEDRKNKYSYFSVQWFYHKKMYRLVWLLEDNETYIGVINFYRN
jgi:hypothetical protein